MQFLLPVVYKNNIDFPNCSSLQTEVTYSMTSNNANVYVENKKHGENSEHCIMEMFYCCSSNTALK